MTTAASMTVPTTLETETKASVRADVSPRNATSRETPSWTPRANSASGVPISRIASANPNTTSDPSANPRATRTNDLSAPTREVAVLLSMRIRIARTAPLTGPPFEGFRGRTDVWTEGADYELKAGDFTLKCRPMRRPISQAARSAALSIAALGCDARACVLIWPARPRSTVTTQRNWRRAVNSRPATTSTAATRGSYGAIDVKKRYSAYARFSSAIGVSMPEILIRIAATKAICAPAATATPSACTASSFARASRC